jgi:hypothetical protein
VAESHQSQLLNDVTMMSSAPLLLEISLNL